MNKTDLVEALARELRIRKTDAAEFLEKTISLVQKSLLAGDDVTLMGFGTFSVIRRKPRRGRHPVTKESILVPGSVSAKFKAGKEFRAQLNQKKA